MQILRTGFVGLNAITGDFEGLPIGRSSLWQGLPHNYRTGMLYSVVSGVVMANEPDDDEMYGAIVVSSELNIELLATMFQRQFHYQSGQVTGLCNVDPFPDFGDEEVTTDMKLEYIETVGLELGWVIKFVTPTHNTFDEAALRAEIDQLVSKAEADGEKLTIKLVAIDNLDHCRVSAAGPRHPARIFRNLADTMGFHLAVTDLLGPEAAELRRAIKGPLEFLNTIRGKGYAATNFLEMEFDQSFHLLLVKDQPDVEDRVYVSIDKNRGPGVPKRSCICAYPLEEGFLPFDVIRAPPHEYVWPEPIYGDAHTHLEQVRGTDDKVVRVVAGVNQRAEQYVRIAHPERIFINVDGTDYHSIIMKEEERPTLMMAFGELDENQVQFVSFEEPA